MQANNVIELKKVEKPEPLIDSDYFGSEKIPVHDLLTLIDLAKKAKDDNT